MRFPSYPTSTSVAALTPVAQILGGRVEFFNIDKEDRSQPGSHMDEEYLYDLYVGLNVMGEKGEIIEIAGLSWKFPNSACDTPERSRMSAKHCVEVMKSVAAHSKPRRAIRDATVAMESILLARRESVPCALCG